MNFNHFLPLAKEIAEFATEHSICLVTPPVLPYTPKGSRDAIHGAMVVYKARDAWHRAYVGLTPNPYGIEPNYLQLVRALKMRFEFVHHWPRHCDWQVIPKWQIESQPAIEVAQRMLRTSEPEQCELVLIRPDLLEAVA